MVLEWDSFIPETRLQAGMKKVIDRINDREQQKLDTPASEKPKPLRRSPRLAALSGPAFA
jgi:hypothetical protein